VRLLAIITIVYVSLMIEDHQVELDKERYDELDVLVKQQDVLMEKMLVQREEESGSQAVGQNEEQQISEASREKKEKQESALLVGKWMEKTEKRLSLLERRLEINGEEEEGGEELK